jgi:hypothetical protein
MGRLLLVLAVMDQNGDPALEEPGSSSAATPQPIRWVSPSIAAK